MPRNAHLDPDAIMRAVDPGADPPSAETVDAALRRLLAEPELERVPAALRSRGAFGRHPVRVATAAALVVAATAAGLGAITLLTASGTTPGVADAWAKAVVVRTASVAAWAGHGVLRIDTRVTETSADRTVDVHYRVQSWTRLGTPPGYWQTISSGSDVTTTTLLGDHVETYDSATNTLSLGAKRVGGGAPQAALLDPAYHAVLTVLYPRDAAGRRLPPTFALLVARVLRSADVTVDRHAHIDGRPAIRITSLHGRALLYVQPRTLRPLGFVTRGDPGATPGSAATITMRFAAYQTVPRRWASPPNLQQLHPEAKVT
jgi:hypothetical protein